MNMHTPQGDGWQGDQWQGDPSESDVFAASDPFAQGTFVSNDDPFSGGFSAAEEPFVGVDAFAPGGPVPAFGAEVSPPSIAHASCIEVHRSLTFYLDGELAHEQEQIVRHHLSVCPPCQSAQAFQMQLRTVVAHKAIDPVPDDVRARITKALGFE